MNPRSVAEKLLSLERNVTDSILTSRPGAVWSFAEPLCVQLVTFFPHKQDTIQSMIKQMTENKNTHKKREPLDEREVLAEDHFGNTSAVSNTDG